MNNEKDWKEWETTLLREGIRSVVDSSLLKDLEPYVMDALKGYENPSTYFFILQDSGLEGIRERSGIGTGQFEYEQLLQLYARNILEIEKSLWDDAPIVAQAYYENVESKSYAEIAIDQHLKNLSRNLSLELDGSLDEVLKREVSKLSREDLLDGLNHLETHWVAVKDRLEYEFNERQSIKQSSIVQEAERELGSDWKHEKVSEKQEHSQSKRIKL